MDEIPTPPDLPYINYDWAGPFVGINVGLNGVTHSENGPSGSFMGGVQVGYNFQVDRFVFGPVADFNMAWRPADVAVGLPGAKFDSRWNASLRMRAGVVFDKLFIYGTGGIEAAEGKLSGIGWQDKNVHLGWTAGAGVEYLFKPNWTLGAEARYTDFGSKTYNNPLGQNKVEWGEFKAMIRLNYKF